MADKIIIPAVKSTKVVTTSTITFVDGVIVTIVGSNTIATRKAAYEAYIKAHPPKPILKQVKVNWIIKRK